MVVSAVSMVEGCPATTSGGEGRKGRERKGRRASV
jgi:hypothetical protein